MLKRVYGGRGMKKRSKIMLLILAVCISCSIVSAKAQKEQTTFNADSIYTTMDGVLDWLRSTIQTTNQQYILEGEMAELAGTSDTDWYTLGMGRYGVEENFDLYLQNLENYVTQAYQEEGLLDRNRATEWHRISLAILAAGGDPTSFGTDKQGNPVNLIADGTYYRGKIASVGTQGINGYGWALIAMDALRYAVPEDAVENRETLIQSILKQQSQDGGFSLDGQNSDVDVTAMMIQALSPYYNNEKVYTYKLVNQENQEHFATVREVIDEALEFLSSSQCEEGDFQSWDVKNSESTSQVIVALCSLGIHPLTDEKFIKNGKTVIDGLMKYHMEDGGFAHSIEEDKAVGGAGESNTMAGEQALYALVAYCRLELGMRNLYDFREEMSDTLKGQITKLEADINKLGETEKPEKQSIEEVFTQYLEIPAEERCYVSNYYKLAQLMEEQGIENTSEDLVEAMNLNVSGKGRQINLKEVKVQDNSLKEDNGESHQVIRFYLIIVIIALVIMVILLAVTVMFLKMGK